MKKLYVIDQKRRLKPSDIKVLERYIKVALPQDYKDFLLIHNGGHPQKSFYPMTSTQVQGADIAWFYGIHDGDISNIMLEYEKHLIDSPKELLPIGYGSGGNNICLGIEGKIFGKVYFNVKSSDGSSPDNMYKIAENFTDFINSLYGLDLGDFKDNGSYEFIINTHDKYSLPFSTEVKKFGSVITDFFAKAPEEVEDYIIEEYEKTGERILKYEVKSSGKKFIRKLDNSGKIIELM